MLSCDETKNLLSAYYDGELGVAAASEVAEHLDSCEECRKLGNGADRTLHFLSHIRKRINEATERGELKKRVRLSFDAYEGTDTLEAPENKVPQNLIDAGDYPLYCPILRCYHHNIDDSACDKNTVYDRTLRAWEKTGMKIAMNEYYNVSKYEDLPLLFTERTKFLIISHTA